MSAYQTSGFSTTIWQHGPSPGSFYDPPGSCSSYQQIPVKRTLHPSVTGTSVLGVKFDGGVILAADMLGSYGSMARYRNVSRVRAVNSNTAIAVAGDYADFQFLNDVLEQKIIDDECLDDGHGYTPKALFSWLTRVMYNRRSKFNPLWNVVALGGFYKGEPFLGYVDKIGSAYESPTVANGFGAYIALPMMRDALEKNPAMTEDEAKALIDRCMRVLFYRDARSFNKYEVVVITKDGVRVEPPVSSTTNWDLAHMVDTLVYADFCRMEIGDPVQSQEQDGLELPPCLRIICALVEKGIRMKILKYEKPAAVVFAE